MGANTAPLAFADGDIRPAGDGMLADCVYPLARAVAVLTAISPPTWAVRPFGRGRPGRFPPVLAVICPGGRGPRPPRLRCGQP